MVRRWAPPPACLLHAASLASLTPGKRFPAIHCLWPPARETRNSRASADSPPEEESAGPHWGPRLPSSRPPIPPPARSPRPPGWLGLPPAPRRKARRSCPEPAEARELSAVPRRLEALPPSSPPGSSRACRAESPVRTGSSQRSKDLFGLRREALLLLTLADVQRTGQPAHGNPGRQGSHFSSLLAVVGGRRSRVAHPVLRLAVRLSARPKPLKPAGRFSRKVLKSKATSCDGSADHLNLAQIAGSDAELFGQPQFVVAPEKRYRRPSAPWDCSSWRPKSRRRCSPRWCRPRSSWV